MRAGSVRVLVHRHQHNERAALRSCKACYAVSATVESAFGGGLSAPVAHRASTPRRQGARRLPIHTIRSGLMLLWYMNVVMVLEKFPEHAAIANEQTAREEQQHELGSTARAGWREPDEHRHEGQRREVEIAAGHQHQQRRRQPLGRNPGNRNHHERQQRARRR